MQYSSLGLGLHLSSIGAQRARKRSEFCHIADCEPAVSSSGRGRQAPSPRATVRQSLGAGVDRGLTGLGVVEETGYRATPGRLENLPSGRRAGANGDDHWFVADTRSQAFRAVLRGEADWAKAA